MKALRLPAWGVVIWAAGGLVALADGRPEPVVYTPKPPICCEVAYFGYDWTGFYVGAHAGMAFTNSEWTIAQENFPLIAAFVSQLEHSTSGIAGGVHIGAQKQWANLIAGIEASYTGLDGDITVHPSVLGLPSTRPT